MQTRWLVLAALALAAGCLGSSTDAEPRSTSAEPANAGSTELPAYELTCPPGASQDTANPCLASLSRLGRSLDEPDLAIHPADGDHLAVGVNAHDIHQTVRPQPSTPGATVGSLQVYTTEDGGRSWQQAQMPPVPAAEERTTRGSLYSDPALTYDEEGRLHATGMVSHNVHTWRTEGAQWTIFHTARSPETGTWNEPTILSEDGDNDRQWVTATPDGAIVLPWQDPIEATEVVWSPDGGQTWVGPPSGEDPPRFGNCAPSTRALSWNASIHLLCAGRDGFDVSGLVVLELDREAETLTERARLPGLPGGWKMDAAVTPTGSFVAAATVEDDVLVAASERGPTGWSQPVNLSEALAVDDNLREFELFALETDPWGGVHLLVGGEESCTGPCPPQRTPPLGRPQDRSRQLAHVVVDPGEPSVVQETVLTDDGLDPERERGTGAPRFDDFGSIAFGDDRGWLAFSREGAIAYTVIEPDVGP